MLKVLVVHEGPPWPPYYGGAMRQIALLRSLGAVHEVVFSCPAEENIRDLLANELEGVVHRFLWVPPGWGAPPAAVRTSRLRAGLAYLTDIFRHPLTPASFQMVSNQWASYLHRECAAVDAVICRGVRLAPMLAIFGYERIIVDADDLPSVWFARKAQVEVAGGRHLVEAVRSWMAEQVLARRCARVLVCSEADRRRLLSPKVTLIPNGVTLEEQGQTPIARKPYSALFVGHCGWGPNREGLRWFLEAVWPHVTRALPLATLAIAGRQANAEVVPFATGPGVTLHEDPPSMMPLYQQVVLSVVPLRFAAGTRIKILESLGYGVPVVSTSVGASGLVPQFSEAFGLVVRDSPTALAQAITTVLSEPAPFLLAASEGGRAVKEQCTWPKAMAPLTQNLEVWVAAGSKVGH